MGGSGSGNFYHWWRGTKKTTVEDCEHIDANRWMREGILRAGVRLTGGWRWVYHGGRENSIRYEVNTLDPAWPVVYLSYSLTRAQTKEHDSLNYPVQLTTTRPRFGGLRWWFICPLVVGGRDCNRRVGKLYLPPGGRYFGCRHCYDLTYTSCQESRKHDRLWRMLAANMGVDVATVRRAMNSIGKRRHGL